MFNFSLDGHWFNRDDFRTSIVPHWCEGLWDYPRNPIYRSLMRMVQNNRLPNASIFVGPQGSGKTITAYQLACAASCQDWDPDSHAPCGKCETCQLILFGKDGSYRGGLLEIDATDKNRSGASTAMEQINDAFIHTLARRSSKPGDPERKFIVFIDEAHRLTPTQRETLLKKTERWVGAHVILATTRLDKLGVTGETDEGNPLLSRGDIFRFSYPTHEECVSGLTLAARTRGIELDADVVGWIVRRHVCCPRDCLGELYRLSNHGKHIKKEEVIEEYGKEEWERFYDGSDVPDDGDDDLMVT